METERNFDDTTASSNNTINTELVDAQNTQFADALPITYDSLDEDQAKIDIAVDNLHSISNAIQTEFKFADLWFRSLLKCYEERSIVSHISRLEDSLLSLAASNEVEGILYFNIIQSLGLGTTLCRVFEYGRFGGMTESQLFKEIVRDDFLRYDIYVEKDVEEERKRSKIYLNTSSGLPKPKKAKRSNYERLLKENKNSVVNSLKFAVSEIDKIDGFQCNGFGVVVFRIGAKYNDGNNEFNRLGIVVLVMKNRVRESEREKRRTTSVKWREIIFELQVAKIMISRIRRRGLPSEKKKMHYFDLQNIFKNYN